MYIAIVNKKFIGLEAIKFYTEILRNYKSQGAELPLTEQALRNAEKATNFALVKEEKIKQGGK